MNMIRCLQGHFYDGDTNASCPYCNRQYIAREQDPNETIPKQQGTLDKDKTVPKQPTLPVDLNQTISKNSFVKDAKTVRPVVGWLVCISGADVGTDYRLISGHNFVGRDPEMNVVIKGDLSVSRSKHCVVTYEPVQNKFFVHQGESHELCYLNGNVVLNSMMLAANDILTIGASKLLFIPCCTEAFHWDLEKKEGERKDV